ncbi:MAG TPA: class I SAM-dependent methyltransferase [Candidatus Coprenecus pullistercoris]|nr:class I SAM-dependent methyltransferase [Candidatus Coprenecus pullistercoris]
MDYKDYSKDRLSAGEAQKMAEIIAFGPVVFQISRIMLKSGILGMLRDSEYGMTAQEISDASGYSVYAVKVLMESSLTLGTVLYDFETGRYSLGKTGWFLLTDEMVRVNMDFNHDVNYIGMFDLDSALKTGKPSGLRHFGQWQTIYEGLSQLPEQVQLSWFAFDHFYSDNSFGEALEIVFSRKPHRILDVGGNLGAWALKCVEYDPDVRVTIADLPPQIEMMRRETAGRPGAERIDAWPVNVLEPSAELPSEPRYDAVWMSQFLDCFSLREIESILGKASRVLDGNARLYVMETLWDRQRYETAAFCLTQISPYFTALANGCSKMYSSADLTEAIRNAGFEVVRIYDHIGLGHSVLECKIK